MTCIAVMVATTPGSKKAKASSTRQAASLIAALGALLQYQTSSTILTTKHTSSTVPMQSSPRTNGGSLALAVGSAFFGCSVPLQFMDFLNELADDIAFQGADLLAMLKQHSTVLAACNAEVCLFRFSGAVYHTAHNGNFDV